MISTLGSGCGLGAGSPASGAGWASTMQSQAATTGPTLSAAAVLSFPQAWGKLRREVATDDLTLVKRVRSGDQRAFKLLVERYQRKIFSVALGMVKDKEE